MPFDESVESLKIDLTLWKHRRDDGHDTALNHCISSTLEVGQTRAATLTHPPAAAQNGGLSADAPEDVCGWCQAMR